MVTTVTYTCDRCGKVISADKVFHVGITCEHADFMTRSQYYAPVKCQKVEWCASCVQELGVRRPNVLRPDTTIAQPTIEDMIREIVRSEQNGGG